MMRRVQLSLGLLLLFHFYSYSQNIAVNTTGTAAASTNLFEVTQSSSTNNTVGIFSRHSGTGTNAYAIWAEATGATNKYAIVVPNGGGNVGIGTIAPIGTLHIMSSSPNYIDRTSNVSNEGAVYIHRRARGTVSTPTAVQNGDELAKFLASGYDGTSYIWTGGISAIVNGTVAAGSVPTDLVFGVSAAHMGNPQSNEAMRITYGKRVGIGTSSPDGLLQVASASGTGRQIVVGGTSTWPGGWGDLSSNVSGVGVFGGNMYADWNPAAYKYSVTHGSIGAMGFLTNYPYSNWASVVTSGTTSSTAGSTFTPSPIAVFDYTGKVGIGSGFGSIASKLYVVDNSSRQIAATDWLDMSSDGAGYGVVGGNVYTNWGDNTFRYSQSHGSIGGIGFATNWPSWNQASIFTSGTTSSTGAASFTPTSIATFDYSGKVGIGTNSPGSKLDVKGTLRLSGATSGYVGLAPAAAAGSTTYTLPASDGSAGQALLTNGSAVLSWGNPSSVSPTTGTSFFEDFLRYGSYSNTIPFVSGPVGWNARMLPSGGFVPDVVTTSDGNRPGAFRFRTSGTSGHELDIADFIPGNAVFTFETSIKESNLSGAAASGTEYNRRIGIMPTSTYTEPTNGIYFRTIANGNWECVTRNGGTETSNATTVAPTAGTWRKLKIVSSGTSVSFYIDGTLVFTHTTNLPASTTYLSPVFSLQGVGASSAGIMLVDWVNFSETLTR